MAVKNHALDARIVTAARAEFLEKGFRGASLQQIAARAELTTGALYTRYQGKDDLFCSLVRDVLEEAARLGQALYQPYMDAQQSGDPAKILQVIRQEERVYQDLLFRYPDSCMLLFCRSSGSSLETQLETMMEEKAQSTVAYLKTLDRSQKLDLDGVELLITSQFDFYRKLLEKHYDRDKALRCLHTLECYMDAGWQALFEAIL